MQKGFGAILVVIIILVLGGLAGGGYYFYQTKVSEKPVNSYDECTKVGNKVQESYPAVCVTKYGKRFVQVLSDEEKKKLIPPPDGRFCAQVITPAKNPKTSECKEFPTPCDVPEGWEKVESCDKGSVDETANWKTYTNQTYKFSIKYHPNFVIVSNNDSGIDLYNKNPGQMDISPGDIKMRISVNRTFRNFNIIYSALVNTIIKEEQHADNARFTKVRNITVDNFKAVEYRYEVPSDGIYTTGVIIDHVGDLIEISSWDKNLDNFWLSLATFKFLK